MTNRPKLTELHAGPASLSSQSLSCLIDGELDAAECARLLEGLVADPEARREWLMFHLAGDALRSSEVACLQSEKFLLRLGAVLEAEPAIVAPRLRRSRMRLVRRVVLPGAAVAAAATMLAVIAVPQLRGDEPGATQTVAAPAVTSAPVTTVSTAPTARSSAVPAPVPNEVRRLAELEAYLSAHRELAGGSMMPRSAPYLRASAPASR
jgi:sigma-E factor negative regulatory protein RseA